MIRIVGYLGILAIGLLFGAPSQAGVGSRLAAKFNMGLPAEEDFKSREFGEENNYAFILEGDLEILDFFSLYGKIANETYKRTDRILEIPGKSDMNVHQWPLDLGIRYGFMNSETFRWYSVAGVKFAQAEQTLEISDEEKWKQRESDIGLFFGTGIDFYFSILGLHAEALYQALEQEFDREDRMVSIQSVWQASAGGEVYITSFLGVLLEVMVEGVQIDVKDNELDRTTSFDQRPVSISLGIVIHAL